MTDTKYSYAYISSATTTQVYDGACTLIAVVVGTTAAGSVKIIDGNSGTTTNFAELQASILPGVYEFKTGMATGIRIVTGAASLITVIYKKN